jgi:HPt (histidine-containing phosphotransfer) domain-containing protein
MSLEQCYAALEGDYSGVTSRLGGERLVKKFILRFLDDASYENLKKNLADGNHEEAFRAAHTLKGVCQNLSLTKLYKSSSAVTEALRENRDGDAQSLMEGLTADYAQTVGAIEAFKADNNA